MRCRVRKFGSLLLIILLYALSLVSADPLSFEQKKIAVGGRVTGCLAARLVPAFWFTSRDRYLYRYREGDEAPVRCRLPDRAASSPVEGAEGKIYLLLEDGRLFAATPGCIGAWFFQNPKGFLSPMAGEGDGTLYLAGKGGGLFAVAHTGRLRWSLQLPSQPRSGPVLVRTKTGERLIVVSCEGRRSYAYGTDGVLRWTFLSAGEVLFPKSDGRRLFLPTDAGTITAVDDSGVLIWEHQLPALAADCAVDVKRGLLFIADRLGNVTCLDATSGTAVWEFPAGRAIFSLVVLPDSHPAEREKEAALAICAEAGGIVFTDEAGRVLNRISTPAPAAPLSTDGRGLLLFGGSDWLFRLYRFSSGSSASQDAEDEGEPKPLFSIKEPPFDFHYLQSIASSADRNGQVAALAEIQDRLESGKPDRGSSYLPILLHYFASAAIDSPIREGGALRNDFPTLRITAVRMLARYGHPSASRVLSRLIRYEWDPSVRIAAYHALRTLLDDPEGDARAAVRDRLSSMVNSRKDEQEVSAASDALFYLAAYHGGLEEKDLELLLAVAYGPFGRETRSSVLDTLRQGGKRRLY
ncbi:Pyrrolo-quinoline quinone [Sediminispirochaeta smaragdinae DSM 11293]|uniref:Pyrrolo-quinoline quinone n=1 Tax=Sediminispirochaeta smaragdinae (strain DSM 11293 / JCM 15392 / SEBR 4228) TaxID=573413 RepID=E1R686_SEDSS|nr:Pyrrolo-quinoline quinone [Sediminispirochaeta smaragdinae DSM 11293]